MVKFGSVLIVRDNSGARLAKCLNVVGINKKTAFVGDIILISVVNYVKLKKLKKRAVYLGAIVTTSYWTFRCDGVRVKFFSNGVLLFSRNCKFLGTRIYGMFLKEVKLVGSKARTQKKYFLKIVSYNKGLI